MADLKITIGASCKAALDEINKLQGSVSGIGSKLNGLLASIGAGLSISAVISYFNSMTDTMNKTAKAARRLGVDTATYQAVVHQYEMAGASAETFEKNLNKVTQAVSAAANGNEEAAGKLGLIGVAWEDLHGKSPVAQLQAVAAALVEIKDPAERSAKAVELFGDEGTKILNVAENLKSIDGEGMNIIDEKSLKAAEELGDAITEIKKAIMAKIADSGMLQWVKDMVEGIKALMGLRDKGKNEVGRKGAVNESIQRARASGKFSEAQLTDMAKYSTGYIDKEYKPLDKKRQKAYANIDKALKDTGYDDIARKDAGPELRLGDYYKPEIHGFGGMEFGGDVADKADAEMRRNWKRDQEHKYGLGKAKPMTAADRDKYDPRVKEAKEKKAKEEAEKKKREEIKRKAEEKSYADAKKKADEQFEKQLNGLDKDAKISSIQNSGKEGAERDAYIQKQVDIARDNADVNRKAMEDKAAKTGKKIDPRMLESISFNDEREKKVRDRAGKAYDASEGGRITNKINESGKDLKKELSDELSEMDKKLEKQKLINAGRKREAEIQSKVAEEEKKRQKAMDTADKEAKAKRGYGLTDEEKKKFQMSDEERKQLQEKAGAQFDAENIDVAAPQMLKDRASDAYSRIGGTIGGASAASVKDSRHSLQTVEKLNSMDSKMTEILGIMHDPAAGATL